MNDALKQAMIECLKIYVRTEMARLRKLYEIKHICKE